MARTLELRYDFYDILKAPRIVLSGKYLLAQARPLVYGYAVYLALTYVALLIEGHALDSIWAVHTLFPFVHLGLSHWYTRAVWLLGIIIAGGFYDYGALTVSRLALEELKGEPFYSLKKASSLACSDLRPFWVVWIVISLLMIVLSLLQGVTGLVAQIPYVGEIIFAFLYALPFVFWSLFVVFLGFGLATAIFTLPAIVVAREQDAFAASFYIYNVIWTQPLRWLAHTALGLVMAKLGIFIFGYFLMRAMQLTAFTTTLFAGEKIQNLLNSSFSLLEPARPIMNFFTSLYPGSRISYDWLTPVTFYQPQPSEFIASIVILIGMVILWLVIISYGINIVTCSQLISFIINRFHEDGEKLATTGRSQTLEPLVSP